MFQEGDPVAVDLEGEFHAVAVLSLLPDDLAPLLQNGRHFWASQKLTFTSVTCFGTVFQCFARRTAPLKWTVANW